MALKKRGVKMMCERVCEGLDWVCERFAGAGHRFIRWIDGLSDFECGFLLGIGLCFLIWLGE
ncbi:hypothetical protein [Acidaminococcus sp.]|uniref:hypothetical protein n=1 Tax=Acidaminococcus sp. TaxID=1872103 RepID=UPI003D7D0EE2